ncbi:hypothetical protein ACKKBG_A05585 [Auxenochlorella protothecoides x Auxenochlorella symbiontica]
MASSVAPVDSSICVNARSTPARRWSRCFIATRKPIRHARRVLGTARAVADPVQPTPEDQKTIDDINEIFGVEDHVEAFAGPGGLPFIRLSHACGSSVEISLFGGQITSFRQASGDEVLYIRPDAVFDRSKPIAGGIPLCFPQFGPGAIQQHGFARNVDWSVSDSSADPNPDDREPEVQLLLRDNEFTRSIWPHEFQAALTVNLHGERLRLDFRVINPSSGGTFDFTAALHSYIEVVDVERSAVVGLQGLKYLDKVVSATSPPECEEEGEAVLIQGPVDRVYLDAGEYAELHVGNGAAVALSSHGWRDAVVWNPWTAMPDAYRRFVCVENAVAAVPIRLDPGSGWRARLELYVKDL